jgi:uncharacterized membrane protein
MSSVVPFHSISVVSGYAKINKAINQKKGSDFLAKKTVPCGWFMQHRVISRVLLFVGSDGEKKKKKKQRVHAECNSE